MYVTLAPLNQYHWVKDWRKDILFFCNLVPTVFLVCVELKKKDHHTTNVCLDAIDLKHNIEKSTKFSF